MDDKEKIRLLMVERNKAMDVIAELLGMPDHSYLGDHSIVTAMLTLKDKFDEEEKVHQE